MKKVLIIEDEKHTRENLRTILEMEGYLPLTACDGESGIATALRDAPDLVLCDVTMPKVDGFAVLATLRNSPRTESVPFIFLTARGDRPDVRAGMNLGADDYLTKPASADEVLAAIEARLARVTQRKNMFSGYDDPAPLRSMGLTPREAEVLLWVSQGKSNPEIAAIVGSAENTVKVHLSRIYEKLGVENRHAASLAALEVLAQHA